MNIAGQWYADRSSTRYAANLRVSEEKFTLIAEQQQDVAGEITDVRISDRVGSIQRRITFKDGAVFITNDNDAVDQWISSQPNSGSAGGVLHMLESHWGWVGIALIVLLAGLYGGYFHGLPWASKSLANKMPASVLEKVTDSTMELLDEWIMQPSGLDENKQAMLINRFDHLVVNVLASQSELERSKNHPSTENVRFAFRKMGAPNAFALPNGQIVITDALVKLAVNEHELDAVILHELAHVRYQHGMQNAVRSFFITVFLSLVIGDPSGMEEMLVALPTALAQSKYSRDHESEADDFAFRTMMEINIDPIHFANIMEKMENFIPEIEIANGEPGSGSQQSEAETGHAENVNDSSLLDYFQSHPVTSSRIDRAIQMSNRFKQK